MLIKQSIEEVLNYFQKNAPNGKNYYLLGSNVISNLPKTFYDQKGVIEYQPPSLVSDGNIILFSSIKQNLDLLNAENLVPNFQLNKCFENSSMAFHYLSQLNGEKDFGVTSQVKIVFGVYSHSIPLSQTQDGTVLNNQEIKIHDWHVWNYINGLLIDTTVIKNSDKITYFPTGWGAAEDHIFIHPNVGDVYNGIEFDDYNKFEEYFKQLFTQQY